MFARKRATAGRPLQEPVLLLPRYGTNWQSMGRTAFQPVLARANAYGYNRLFERNSV